MKLPNKSTTVLAGTEDEGTRTWTSLVEVDTIRGQLMLCFNYKPFTFAKKGTNCAQLVTSSGVNPKLFTCSKILLSEFENTFFSFLNLCTSCFVIKLPDIASVLSFSDNQEQRRCSHFRLPSGAEELKKEGKKEAYSWFLWTWQKERARRPILQKHIHHPLQLPQQLETQLAQWPPLQLRNCTGTTNSVTQV